MGRLNRWNYNTSPEFHSKEFWKNISTFKGKISIRFYHIFIIYSSICSSSQDYFISIKKLERLILVNFYSTNQQFDRNWLPHSKNSFVSSVSYTLTIKSPATKSHDPKWIKKLFRRRSQKHEFPLHTLNSRFLKSY